ncbi:aminopeptidase N [Amycolatopsis arida]|uniref:Aminopeptidase N n=1 Tax=Amycolatopsis arida TaxID=587909 RepID=A0A1I5Z253_9PSEU|nr:aminopeptidase N [Amycolatopsis arida]TDX90062.1 aminopeptidase N [Amycolatopsis arida]SFQ50584.1 aminopeptidase N [Amycolatopsis arida]
MSGGPTDRAALTRAEAAERATVVRDPSYHVELDLRADAATFTSHTTIRFAARSGASTFLDLTAAAVEKATLNGRPLPTTGRHRLPLPDLRSRNELVVRARCSYSRTGLGLSRFRDPADGATYVFSQCQPFAAHRIYPCFDQPDLKARIAVTVLAPPDWVVVGNGPAHRFGTGWRLAPTPPIPTYTSAVVAGPLHQVHERHGDVPLGLSCRRSIAGLLDAGEVFRLTRWGLDFYRELFGRPYPFPTYHQVFVPEFPMGGMENVGCVLLGERYLFRSTPTEPQRIDRAAVLLHEMAHMWFGNLTTMRWWDDLWLNEAVATHAATLGLAAHPEFGERAWVDFAHRYKARAYAEDQGRTAHPVLARVGSTAGLLTRFDDITYAKGAALLKQLAHWVGPTAFADGVRRLLREHAFGTVDRADFLRALADASGRDLDQWADEWLDTTGAPTLRTDATIGPDGRYTEVVVHQLPAHPGARPRRQRIALGHYTATAGALNRTWRREVDLRGPRTPVPELVGRPAGLLLPNDDDLGYARLAFDAYSLTMLTERLGELPSALARTLCWTALWELTRDAELATGDWVRLVARHAVPEPDIGLRRELLDHARHAIEQYSAPDREAELRVALAAAARTALDRADPGGTEQRGWVRYLVAVEDDPAFAHGLFTGTITVDGLAVDPDLRWHLVIRLATLGAVDQVAIAAQRRRDPGDLGRRKAWLAWASLPDPAVKAAAFAAAVEGVADGTELSLAVRDAILTGFWRPGQYAVLAEYAEHTWVDAVARLWAEHRPEEELLTLTTALYPACRPTAAILAAAGRLLAGDLPPAGRHIVREGADETRRALRAQAADHRAREGR